MNTTSLRTPGKKPGAENQEENQEENQDTHDPAVSLRSRSRPSFKNVMSNRIAVLLLPVLLIISPVQAAEDPPETPGGSGEWEDLVEIYDEFVAWRANEPAGGAVWADWGPEAMATRADQLARLRQRLDDLAVSEWERPQQVDWLAVRSRFDQEAFLLEISRPWARDPGFYVDRLLWITFTELPADGQPLASLRTRLTAIPDLVAQAKRNLTDVASDYAALAIFNLTTPDGVGHGHPYRAVPPAGVLGWYDDLLERAQKQQPQLVPQVAAARDAVADLLDWLRSHRAEMTGQAGVGREAFDWYLKHVKLMPWTSAEIEVLGQRELDRLRALYALERHRNRNLPELETAANADDYAERIARADARVRAFLVEEDIITVPDSIGELDTNVPWIERPGGLNFWEQVQFRDPTPDHLHAVIPGHRFDARVEDENPHPIRGRFTSAARAEGWATYLEEAMLHAGFMAGDEHGRLRELIYIFGIFRAARVPADVWLQTNRMKTEEVVDWWRERVPYLDEDVARVDAEIYLRRPPGYGLGYTIGALQMQRLLADRRRQLGDDFDLEVFHDAFMAAGRLPLSLLRWEMTGMDDEVRDFWASDPMPAKR